MSDQEPILVAIYTDGMGTFQAQCLGCSWRGPWRRKESAAVVAARRAAQDGVA